MVASVVGTIPICPIVHVVAIDQSGCQCVGVSGNYNVVLIVIEIVVINADRPVVLVIVENAKSTVMEIVVMEQPVRAVQLDTVCPIL